MAAGSGNKILDAHDLSNIFQTMNRQNNASVTLSNTKHVGLRNRRASAPGSGAHDAHSSPRLEATGVLNGSPPLPSRQIYPEMAKKWRSGLASALSPQHPAARYSAEPGAGMQPPHMTTGSAHPEWSGDNHTASSRSSEAGTSVAQGQDLGPHLRDSSLTLGPRRVSRFSEAGVGSSVEWGQDLGPHPRNNCPPEAGPRRASVAFQISDPGGDSGLSRMESCSSANRPRCCVRVKGPGWRNASRGIRLA
eukprot:gene12336-15512_t